jgi:hypothetical protein
LISRRQIVGIALASGLMFAGGTGLAVADGTSATPEPTVVVRSTTAPSPAECAAIAKQGASDVRITASNGNLSIVKCVAAIRAGQVRGVVPKGAPETGGGGMAAEVGSWG